MTKLYRIRFHFFRLFTNNSVLYIHGICCINRQMARLWRNRWLETDGKDLSILQRLQDQERVGAPVKFSMEQVIELWLSRGRILFSARVS